jgi:putative DNA primase/helicase
MDYDPDADCENVLNHFRATLSTEEDVRVMLELFGYLLLKEYKIEKALMFVGFGRNGKSKTIELMKRFIGAENCASLPLRCLMEESFSLSELFGKMANLAADLSKTDLKETGIIKSLIGRDTIQAKRKYLRDLNFVNYAKMVFAANELPKIYDTTDGFWTKWVLLEFPYKFVTQETYDSAEEQEKVNWKIMNPEIIEKISTSEELSGLLNLALDGLDRLLENKDFSYSKSTQDVKDMWIRKSDSFTAFCYDHIIDAPENKLDKKLLRKLYHIYTKKHKVSGCSDKAIKITLENMFGISEIQTGFGERDRVWEGINFKNIDKLEVKS